MRIFCIAKDSHIFPTKNYSVYVIFTFKILTKRLLTTSLISNNWPLVVKMVLVAPRLSIRFSGFLSTVSII